MPEKKIKLEDIEAEKIILAGLFTSTERVDKALLTINSKYFTKSGHKRLFTIATSVYRKHGSLLTVDLVSSYMESWGIQQTERIKVLDFIDKLKKLSVNDAEFAFAMRSVKEAYVAKEISTILVSTSGILESKGGHKAFKALDKKLYDLKLTTIDSNYLEVIDSRKVDDLLNHFKEMRENPEKFRGIPSGWKVLDDLTGGFMPAEYVLLIAKSGSGKSMALINWANHASKIGYNVVYVSLEMPQLVIRERVLSLESEIPFIDIKTQNLTAEQLNRQDYVLKNDIANRNGEFFIIDVPKCTIGLIEAQLRQLQQNMRIDVIFIDYLGLLKPEAYSQGKSGWEQVSEISNDMRELARTMKIPVISAAQVNAEGMKKRSDDDLEIEDIALSKRIADPASLIVGLIWDKTNPNEMRMSVPKCRNGRIQSARLWCDLDRCAIADRKKEEPTKQVSEKDLEGMDL